VLTSSAIDFSLRHATLADVRALQRLIETSSRALGRSHYTDDEIEAALGSAWAVDTQLIRDATYFIVESAGSAVACGGWSWRATLFGGDTHEGRQPEPLDPPRDAARIRAFFVHPGHARRGIGRMLLERCEQEARAHGFQAAELIATLPGERLYRACGYASEEARAYALPGGRTIRFVPMRKPLV